MADAPSCRSVWNLTGGVNENIVGQGLAPAVWYKIISMEIGRTQFAPTVWDFYQWLKICTISCLLLSKSCAFSEKGDRASGG